MHLPHWLLPLTRPTGTMCWVLPSTLTFPGDLCLELHACPAKRPDWLRMASGSMIPSLWNRHRENDLPTLQQASLPLRLRGVVRAKAEQRAPL